MESLLVMSKADDGHPSCLLEQVDRILLSLHGSVLVEGLYSWGTVIEVREQHYFGSLCEEERGEPCGPVSEAPEDRWDLCNPSPGILFE